MTLDPVAQTIFRVALALLFADAARHKLRDLSAFRAALGAYRLVPRAALGAAAPALAALELATAFAFVVPGLAVAGGACAAALLLLYSGAVAVNLAAGRRDIDCGCAGPGARRPLHGSLLARNALLLGAAAFATLPGDTRAWVWLDSITFVAGLSTLALLYAALDTGLANAARLREAGGSA